MIQKHFKLGSMHIEENEYQRITKETKQKINLLSMLSKHI